MDRLTHEGLMATSVLIVEDEPEFLRRFSEAVLADTGLHLLAAVSTGRAGRAMLDAQPPDVMLIDLGLPDMDGVELIRHAAHHHPGCDVLVVTMFADDLHLLSSIEAGATGYLLKDAGGRRIAGAIHELRAGGSPTRRSAGTRTSRRNGSVACSHSPRAGSQRLAYVRARKRNLAPREQGFQFRHGGRAAWHFAAHRGHAREEDLSQACRALAW